MSVRSGPPARSARVMPEAAARGIRAVAAWALTLAGLVGVAQAQTVRTDLYITNGQVSAQAVRGQTLYVGGSFSFVGAVTGAG
ncbi:MAG: hypothetical protein ABL977_13865, partial [Candidatus Eisenbacteria bacterium]